MDGEQDVRGREADGKGRDGDERRWGCVMNSKEETGVGGNCGEEEVEIGNRQKEKVGNKGRREIWKEGE